MNARRGGESPGRAEGFPQSSALSAGAAPSLIIIDRLMGSGAGSDG